jgi:hypothetical protein
MSYSRLEYDVLNRVYRQYLPEGPPARCAALLRLKGVDRRVQTSPASQAIPSDHTSTSGGLPTRCRALERVGFFGAAAKTHDVPWRLSRSPDAWGITPAGNETGFTIQP